MHLFLLPWALRLLLSWLWLRLLTLLLVQGLQVLLGHRLLHRRLLLLLQ